MATYKHFEEMEVWQRARVLAEDIYKITKEGPFARDFKMRDQINDAAGSVMDNIAEGFNRGGNKEFVQFLSVAKGSASETLSQIHRAHDRKYITPEVYESPQGGCQ
jgi:four helix bundle protein